MSMKNFFFVLIALAAGFVGAYAYDNKELILGATTARTTITNPWTFSATTTGANVILTTTNTATSTLQVGCVQSTATSTDTPIRWVIGSTVAATGTYQGATSQGAVVWQYGKCPRI